MLDCTNTTVPTEVLALNAIQSAFVNEFTDRDGN